MAYVLVSTENFHRGPTSISTIDPYLHEKCPFSVIKDAYFQAEPRYDSRGRCWSFRIEDAPVRVLNKLYDLGFKAITGSTASASYSEHKSSAGGHAWTLFRDSKLSSMFGSR